MKTFEDIVDLPQPTDGRNYLCCYCEQPFKQFEQPLFLIEHKVAHTCCHQRAEIYALAKNQEP